MNYYYALLLLITISLSTQTFAQPKKCYVSPEKKNIVADGFRYFPLNVDYGSGVQNAGFMVGMEIERGARMEFVTKHTHPQYWPGGRFDFDLLKADFDRRGFSIAMIAPGTTYEPNGKISGYAVERGRLVGQNQWRDFAGIKLQYGIPTFTHERVMGTNKTKEINDLISWNASYVPMVGWTRDGYYNIPLATGTGLDLRFFVERLIKSGNDWVSTYAVIQLYGMDPAHIKDFVRRLDRPNAVVNYVLHMDIIGANGGLNEARLYNENGGWQYFVNCKPAPQDINNVFVFFRQEQKGLSRMFYRKYLFYKQ